MLSYMGCALGHNACQQGYSVQYWRLSRLLPELMQRLTALAELLYRELLARNVVHTDETPMRILDTRKGGTSRQGYLWSYVSGGHTGNPIVVFECHAGRGAKYPLAFLSEWTGGYLVTDDYDVYKSVAKENDRIINVGCWSHARRRFAELYKASGDPRAGFVLKVLARMFSLEERIRPRSPENKVRWRRRYIKPLLDKLHAWLTEQRDAQYSHTTCRTAKIVVDDVYIMESTTFCFLDKLVLPTLTFNIH